MKYPALLLDTSTRYLFAARIDSDGEATLRILLASSSGEDTLDNAVGELFPEIATLRAIWLGLGPGSFVGLRSSFAYARMLAMLTGAECRTFYSSRLWRMGFAVPNSTWFLTRTNAKLFYGERYTPERDARALEAHEVPTLSGTEHVCYYDSWVPTKELTPAGDLPLCRRVDFKDAVFRAEDLTSEKLHLSEPKPHDELVPLYGHELHFALAANG